MVKQALKSLHTWSHGKVFRVCMTVCNIMKEGVKQVFRLYKNVTAKSQRE